MRIRLLLWGTTVIVFVGLLWSLNLMFFNIWAAGGPPTDNPQLFEGRAEWFAVQSLVFLFLLVISIRSAMNHK